MMICMIPSQPASLFKNSPDPNDINDYKNYNPGVLHAYTPPSKADQQKIICFSTFNGGSKMRTFAIIDIITFRIFCVSSGCAKPVNSQKIPV